MADRIILDIRYKSEADLKAALRMVLTDITEDGIDLPAYQSCTGYSIMAEIQPETEPLTMEMGDGC